MLFVLVVVMAKGGALPVGVMPRGLCRTEAAGYIGVGASLFDQLIRDGRMPRPKVVGARRVWDVKQLDRCFDALPSDGDEPGDNNPWDASP
jgi:hypothetical protein